MPKLAPMVHTIAMAHGGTLTKSELITNELNSNITIGRIEISARNVKESGRSEQNESRQDWVSPEGFSCALAVGEVARKNDMLERTEVSNGK